MKKPRKSRKSRKPGQPNTKYRKKMFLLIGVLVVAVAAVAGGSLFYFGSQGKSDVKAKTSGAKRKTTAAEDTIVYNGKRYQYKKQLMNFLFMGIDKSLPIEERRDTGSQGLADAVMLVSIDTQSGVWKIFAVPRDSVVPIKALDDKGNALDAENKQITLQYGVGRTATQSCRLMSEAVSNLMYKLPIDRYCSINLQAVPILNDAVGGVDVTAVENVAWDGGEIIKGENVHLMGAAALAYVQRRDIQVFASSMGRLERQRQYALAYMAKLNAILKQNPDFAAGMFEQLGDNMCTNITVEDIGSLESKLPEETTLSQDFLVIPGEVVDAGEHEEYHVQQDELKEMVISNFYEEAPEQN